ncbi:MULTISPECIES: DUF1905 domain-containing protein [Flavobacterium]|uniref:DUF1905 domain-containing protein n=1 Tax=Flavobacterium hankyongi TaxID=1176532 RepID=A0ABP8ZYU8_9FLAO|nr:DUF1905 domain-containing protein [Flavobacterium sp. N1846]
MSNLIKYDFSAKIWQYNGPNGWHFVSLPQEISKEIRENLKWQEEGWGRLKATAKIGSVEWKTAIWFDTKQNTYLLPLKADIRKKCKLEKDQRISISILV